MARRKEGAGGALEEEGEERIMPDVELTESEVGMPGSAVVGGEAEVKKHQQRQHPNNERKQKQDNEGGSTRVT